MFGIHRSIGRRLAAAFAAMIMLLIAMAVVSLVQIADVGAQLQRVVEVNNAKSELAGLLLNEIDTLSLKTRSLTMLTDAKEIEQELAALKVGVERYRSTALQLVSQVAAQTPESLQETDLVRQLGASAEAAIPLLQKAAAMAAEGANADATHVIVSALRPAELAWRRQVTEFRKLEVQLNRAAQAHARFSEARARIQVIGVGCVAVALALLLAWVLTSAVTRPLLLATETAERIARGDLAGETSEGGADETGRLLKALGSMQTSLAQRVMQIRTASQGADDAAVELANGNSDLSHRTEQTASSLQAAASSLVQLTQTLSQSAHMAAEARRLALQVVEASRLGSTSVSSVLSSMSEISGDSQRIVQTTSVIDTIAFQTNVLALNAAVEAARAGDHGKGFAVVAGEVRVLSRRSAESAKEIKQVISASVGRVASAQCAMDRANGAMNDAVESIAVLASLIASLSEATAAQSMEVAGISSEVTRLDGLTQQNAALVEEATAATASLRDQSSRLLAAVEVFTLGGAGHGTDPPPPTGDEHPRSGPDVAAPNDGSAEAAQLDGRFI